ncbi:hypothetical protein [Meiothermus sp.]
MNHVQTVQQIYADFGLGNVAGILDVVNPFLGSRAVRLPPAWARWIGSR